MVYKRMKRPRCTWRCTACPEQGPGPTFGRARMLARLHSWATGHLVLINLPAQP